MHDPADEAVLEREGVKLESVEDEFGSSEGGSDDEGYRAVINGETHVIYDAEAAQRADIWSLSLKRLLQIVQRPPEQRWIE